MHWFLVLISLTLLATQGCSDGKDQSQNKTTSEVDAAAQVDEQTLAEKQAQWTVDPGEADSPDQLQFDRRTVYGWLPERRNRLEFVLKDVEHIYFFEDLNLGEALSDTIPDRWLEGWPTGTSVSLVLPAEKTALALRYVYDTLPGARVSGDGHLSLFAVGCDEDFGRSVEVPRTTGATGTISLLYKHERFFWEGNCCELPPTVGMNKYGNPGDTVLIVTVFDRNRSKYVVHHVGSVAVRAITENRYTVYRTERGNWHPDLQEYPNMCFREDSTRVNLILGSSWRGRKRSSEPVITARIF